MSRAIPVFSVRESGLSYQVPPIDPISEPVPDTLRPTVAIVVPTNDSTVSGTVNITATATDNVAISSVRFNIDGVNFGDPIPGPGPYLIPWDTSTYADGTHEIIAVATDTSGNQKVSAAVDVEIANFSPLDGLLWSMPISIVDNSCVDPIDVSVILTANPFKTYNVTLRFRGVVEWKEYSGGLQTGHFVVGGTGASPGSIPDNPIRNSYSLVVSNPPQTYFLNAYISGLTDAVFVIDYTATIVVRGTATLTLQARSENGFGFANSGNLTVPVTGGDPPIIPSQPFAGQFIQMDVVSVVEI